jgi:hypothetical protein
MILKRTVSLLTVLLFLIVPVSAIGFMDPPNYFEVLPNKTYSASTCVVDDPGTLGTLALSNNSGLIAEFTHDEFKPYVSNSISNVTHDIKCTTIHITIADYKTSNEELIVEELSFIRSVSSALSLGMVHEIEFDASQVNYINALLKFSWRLVFTILSIFVLLTSLLYIIRKIRKE